MLLFYASIFDTGDIMSIGISNFEIDLLQGMHNVATILPHILQNFATIGDMDHDARNWSAVNGVLYQPYAVCRNAATFSEDVKRMLLSIAKEHSVSMEAVVYRYFLQSHHAIIPRSTNVAHLIEDLQTLEWQLTDGEMLKLDSLNAKEM